MKDRPPSESSPNLPLILSMGDRGDDFLERVLRVCTLREEARRRRVEVTRKHAPLPFAEYAEVAFVEESGEARTYALAATPGSMSEDILDRFLEVHAEYRRVDPWTFSLLVYGGEPADEGLLRRAARTGVHVRSFVEFQGLVDFRPYLEKQNRRLENDLIYPPRLYVEQSIRLLVAGEETEADDAVAKVEEWLGSPYGRFVLLLGDFGTGKTFLMHELARRLGRPRTQHALCPVLIEMRSLEKSQTLDGLVAQHLAAAGMDRIDLKAFRYMLGEGRIALLFDGFDELALRVTYDRAVDHFETLLQAAGGNAKVVITSRTAHFYSDQQVKSALAEKAAVLPGYRVAELTRFSERQIRRFLVKRLDGDSAQAEARFRLLDEVKDLLGLSQNPRMLNFISDIPDEELWRAKEREGEITAAALYRLILDRWLSHEVGRAHPSGGAPGLTKEQRWSAVTALAKRLWQRTERSVNVAELPDEVASAVIDLGTRQLDPRTAAHQVGSGTLLVRDERGNFSFIHLSVQEWLVAHAAADEVARAGTSPLLMAREMSPLMAEFFTALATHEAATRWAQEVLRLDGAETAKRNAQQVLQRLGVEAGTGANFAGQNLRGRNLNNQNLRGADLRGSDLSEARLVRAVLTDANLRGARLIGADLSATPLDGADLSDADLSFARLLGASLRGAKLLGVRLRAAKLVGAQLDPGAVESTDHFGAALPSPVAIEVQCAASSACRSIGYSPEGDLIASGHDDGSVRLWDLAAGRAIRIIRRHSGKVNGVGWSPSGRSIASAGDDGTVRVCDVATGEELAAVQGKDRARALSWSPDGALIASTGDDVSVRIWSAATGLELRALRGHAGWVRALSWSHDGKKIATGAEDGQIRLWDAASGGHLGALSGHEGAVLSVGWTPGGTLLASGGEDGSVRVWDVRSEKQLQILAGHRGGARTVAWAPDGKALASGGEDKSVRIWEWEMGAEISPALECTATVNSVAWSPDGKALATGSKDKLLRVWDLSADKKFRTLEGHAPHANYVAFSPDGKRLVRGAADHTLRCWDVARGVEISSLKGHDEAVYAAAWSSDGKHLASGSVSGALALWSTGRPHMRRAHDKAIRCLCFSPDGTLLATGSKDNTVRLWNPETASELRVLSLHRGTVVALSFSPDGGRLASGSTDKTVRVIDPTTGAELSCFRDHTRGVQGVAFSPDGTRVASSSDDSTVRIWDAAGVGALRVIDCGPAQVMLGLAWAPAGGLLAAGGTDGMVHVWDPGSGRERFVLRGHTGPVWSIAFRPDGRLLASASTDGTVRLWDPLRGVCVGVFVSLPEGSAAFAPDGRYKQSGDTGGSFWHAIGLCRFEPGELDPFLPGPLRVPDDAPLVLLPEPADGAGASVIAAMGDEAGAR